MPKQKLSETERELRKKANSARYYKRHKVRLSEKFRAKYLKFKTGTMSGIEHDGEDPGA